MDQTALNTAQVKQHCEKHMHRYVLIQARDGWCDGIVEHVDDDSVYLAVPYCQGEQDNRAFLPYGGPIYPYPYFPRRRFIRRRFPLAALLALSLLPFYY